MRGLLVILTLFAAAGCGAGGAGAIGGGAPCTLLNCTGCCDASGMCQLGNSPSACGIDGTACATCLPGALCPAGRCQGGCSPANCLGCCQAGSCVRSPTNASNTSCGKAGNDCIDCTTMGLKCSSSSLTCM